MTHDDALMGQTERDPRPCGYCWAEHGDDLDAEPEGGFAPPHPECLAAVAQYDADRHADA